MEKYNIGDTVVGIVTGIKPYGAFISVNGEHNGLIHISEISEGFVKNIEDFVHVGEKLTLKIIEIDEANNHLKLSLKSLVESKRSNQRKYMQFSKDYRREIATHKQDYNVIGDIVKKSIADKNQEKTVMVNLEYAGSFDYAKYADKVLEIHNLMHKPNPDISAGLGWVNLPNEITDKELSNIINCANTIRSKYNVLVICGIGGSYLGARAGIEMLNGFKKDNRIEVIYMGQTLSSHYTNQTLEYLKGKDFAVNVISKSGTTLESAIAFRLIRTLLIQKYGEEGANSRIFVTTDSDSGLLRKAANERKYTSFSIPKDIGGRYSVLSSVGLFPFAVAGIDIYEVIKGAKKAYLDLNNPHIETNEAYKYAVARLQQYESNKRVEVLVSYEPQLMYLGEWWKQLYGESEGKDKKGLFPACVNNTTDLHSLGQFIQEGTPILFETVLNLIPQAKEIVLHSSDYDQDGLDYLKNQTLTSINQVVLEATTAAHYQTGNVVNIILDIKRYDSYGLGYLFYFFMKSCAMSSYLFGVNPFNQPGVEVYKQNLFTLLGKK